ncbi:MAG: DNA internalization-related competence protein ComEC/Rec2 [Gammaproteobacteria bacterium]|nr:DNA internalization-related competence protein ComEC/Rec2 [Gammaproteobacteria bacterium]
MFGAGIAFLIGVCCVLYAPALAYACVCLGVSVVLLWTLRRCSQRKLLAAFCCGCAWMLWHAHLRLADALPDDLQGRDLQVQGSIVDVPVTRGEFTRFAFDIDAGSTAHTLPRRVRLSWYDNPPALAYGERWHLTVRLKRPHGLRNPGSFDYETWLVQHAIRALGYVRDAPGNRRIAPPTGAWLSATRQHAATALENVGYRHGALLSAITTGLRDGMSDAQWRVLRATGTSHLFAISGLHVGLVAMLGHLLCSVCWRFGNVFTESVSRARFAACGALSSAFCYAALAGFSVPTQRALIMLTVLLLGVFAARGVRPGASLGAALIAVLSVDPWSPLGSGFWLSFGAVAAIAWLLSGRVSGHGKAVAFARVQCGLALLLAPLTLWFFQQAPLLGAAANALAVPVVSLITVPSALGGLAWAGVFSQFDNPLLQLADTSLEFLWMLLTPASGWSHAQWAPPAASWTAITLAASGAVLLTAPRCPLPRYLGVFLLTPLLFPVLQRPPHAAFDITVLDVGQGLAVVVETRHHVLLYDAGVYLSPTYDMGRDVVLPFLRRRGWRSVDKLLVSHADNDHAGGAAAVAAALEVSEILTSVPGSLASLHAARKCVAGNRWHWDGVLFEVLHPPSGWPGGRNDKSCVLRISTGARSVLIPGDIERPAERLLAGSPATLRADVLLVPHHGSATSTSAQLLAQVRPEYAVISAGYRNRFRFPHRQVCARLRARGIGILSTATSGAVAFRVDPVAVSAPVRYRQLRRRFWHHAPQGELCTTQ